MLLWIDISIIYDTIYEIYEINKYITVFCYFDIDYKNGKRL